MLLRYTGALPATFTHLGLEVQPGGDFEVPDDEAPAYLTRADIDTAPEAEAAPAEKAARGKLPAKPDSADPARAAADVPTPAGPVPDPIDTP